MLFAVTALLSLSLFGCDETGLAGGNASILTRVPEGNFFIATFKPREILHSEFVDSVDVVAYLLGSENEWKTLVEEKTGINPEDVDRITVMTSDLDEKDNGIGVIVQGDRLNFDYTSIREAFGGSDSLFQINGYDVRGLKKQDGENAFLFFDNREIIAAGNRELMEQLLTLKRGKGKSLSDDIAFITKYDNLKYKSSGWYHFPTRKIVDDVLGKVYKKKPDYQGEVLEIQAVLGGASFSRDLKVSMQAYNTNEEQLTLLYDFVNGMRALGVLSLMNYPKLQELVRAFQMNKENGYIECEMVISQDNLALIKDAAKKIKDR